MFDGRRLDRYGYYNGHEFWNW